MHTRNVTTDTSIKRCIRIEHLYLFLLELLSFGGIWIFGFSTDSYSTFMSPNHLVDFFLRSNGRAIIGLMYKAWNITGLSDCSFYCLNYVLFLVFIFIACCLVNELIHESISSEILSMTVSFITVANFLIIEYLCFLEKAGFSLGILMACAATYYIVRYFKNRRILYLVFAYSFLIVSALTYQGVVSLFIAVSMPFAFKYKKDFKGYIFNLFLIAAGYALSMLSSFGLLQVLGSQRAGISVGILHGLVLIAKGYFYISLTGIKVMPKGYYLCSVIVLGIINVWGIVSAYRKKERIVALINFLMLNVIVPIASLITIFSKEWTPSPRIVYTLGALPGVLIINLFVNVLSGNESKVRNTVLFRKLISVFCALVIVLQAFCFVRVYIAKYQNDILDRYRVEMIANRISEYTEQTGIEVKKISFYFDGNTSSVQYPVVFSYREMVVSSFARSWSQVDSINYYTNCNYEEVANNPEIASYFQSKDWDIYNDDQLVFDGDTLHICVY